MSEAFSRSSPIRWRSSRSCGSASRPGSGRIGFYVLILLIGGCGALLLRSPNRRRRAAADSAEDAAPPTWRDIASWVFLAAVPSGLLIAVTAHISTDVAAVPLFWVLPLALYLLTFVIVFQTRPLIPHRLVVDVQPIFVLALVVVFIIGPIESIVGLIALHLSVFFVCALMCHGELARRRPAPRYLTAYYMWISVGGMIGGIATGLIAPHVFNWVAEYPLLIVLAVLCRPGLALPAVGTGQYPLLGALGVAALLSDRLTAFDLSFDYQCIQCPGRRAVGADRAVLASAAVVRGHRRLPARRRSLFQRRHQQSSGAQFLRRSQRRRKPRTAGSACSGTAPPRRARSAFAMTTATR